MAATEPGRDPFHPADAAGRAQARVLLDQASTAALAYADAEGPGISRIALGRDATGIPLTLISDLSAHFTALQADPACALLVGEAGEKGDPLNHPRLMLRARAEFLPRSAPDHATLRGLWLQRHPKAKLYIDFADFAFVRLHPVSAVLNAGFGKAMRLTAADLGA
jgi:putative heme iron utilization protein